MEFLLQPTPGLVYYLMHWLRPCGRKPQMLLQRRRYCRVHSRWHPPYYRVCCCGCAWLERSCYYGCCGGCCCGCAFLLLPSPHTTSWDTFQLFDGGCLDTSTQTISQLDLSTSISMKALIISKSLFSKFVSTFETQIRWEGGFLERVRHDPTYPL